MFQHEGLDRRRGGVNVVLHNGAILEHFEAGMSRFFANRLNNGVGEFRGVRGG